MKEEETVVVVEVEVEENETTPWALVKAPLPASIVNNHTQITASQH